MDWSIVFLMGITDRFFKSLSSSAEDGLVVNTGASQRGGHRFESSVDLRYNTCV